MFRKTKLKSLTAILLSVILCSQTFLSVFAQGQEVNVYLSIDPSTWIEETLAIQEKLIFGIKEYWGVECLDEIPQVSGEIAIRMHNTPMLIGGFSLEAFESFSLEEQEEIIHIEWIANALFEFYHAYGFLPTQDEFEYYINNVIMPRGKMLALGTAVLLLLQKGFVVTQFSVAQAAVLAALIVGITNPVPTAQLMQMIVGTTMVEFGHGIMNAIATANSMRRVIAIEVGVVLGLDQRTEALIENSIAQSLAVYNAFRNGGIHFEAVRTGSVGGGIIIGQRINRMVAVERLSGRLPSGPRDTFSTSRFHAWDVAREAAGANGIAFFDNAHNTTNQILNFPHYHVLTGFPVQDRIRSHAFFPWI